jgi:C4-dicarboxylate-binding protein DctP
MRGPVAPERHRCGRGSLPRFSAASREAARRRGMALLGMALLAMMLPAADTQAQPEPVTFRVAMRSSITSPNGRNLVDYKTAVEQGSGGALRFDIRDKGQLYADNQVPEAIRSGALEMAIVQVGLYAKDIPEVGIFQQPFLFDTDKVIAAAIRPESEIRKVIDARILEKMGARVLWWQNYGPTIVMSKGSPLLDPQSMQGRSIRAFDTVSAEFVSLCGGQPQIVPYAKMLEALQTGKVDAVMTGVFGVREVELWRETQYVSRINHSAIALAITVNEGLWQSLTAEQRELMAREARRVEADYQDKFALAETEAYRFAAEKGMAIDAMTADQLGEWRLCSSEVLERFVDRLGNDAAERLMTAYGRLRAAACCTPEAGQSLLNR